MIIQQDLPKVRPKTVGSKRWAFWVRSPTLRNFCNDNIRIVAARSLNIYNYCRGMNCRLGVEVRLGGRWFFGLHIWTNGIDKGERSRRTRGDVFTRNFNVIPRLWTKGRGRFWNSWRNTLCSLSLCRTTFYCHCPCRKPCCDSLFPEMRSVHP